MEEAIRLGISACLLGQQVRYDGGHKLDRFLRDTLGAYVQYVPVCPEAECGLGIPREAMRLVGDPAAPRLLTNKSGVDHTERMKAYAEQRLDALAGEGLSGFIFKSDSPSSGMERVRVYDAKGVPSKTGSGIFARAFMDRFALLPVEEEGRLHDPRLRENFIERIFAHRRWRALAAKPSMGALVEFHASHKLQLLAHSPKTYAELGRLVAAGAPDGLGQTLAAYEALFMKALAVKATPGKNANALSHMAGFFKNELDAEERAELVATVEAHRHETLPLIVPITLIGHYVKKYKKEYLLRQSYLSPHPLELKLRNHC